MARAYDDELPYGQYDPDAQRTPPPGSSGSTPPETPAPGTTPPASTAVDPWTVAPSDGDWQGWFLRNSQSHPPTPSELIALEARLAPHGIKVLRNAKGVAGKIQLPGGEIVDVIEGADAGGKRWQWLTGDGGAAAAETSTGTKPNLDWFAANMPAPEVYTTPDVPDYLKDPYAAPARPDALSTPYVAPEFRAPSFDELTADPGYQARLNAGVLARDRMAAAKGSLLSGGYGKAIERYAQEFGNNEYQNLYGRRFGEFQTQAGLGLGARQMNESAYQDDVVNAQNAYGIRNNAYQQQVGNAANQYATRYRTYRDIIGDQFRLAELGAQTTVAGRP